MKKTYSIRVLGCDNGSGVFEAGGSLDEAKVSVDGDWPNMGSAEFIRSAKDALLRASGYDGDPQVRFYDEQANKIGPHYVVSFTTNEEGAGEQHHAFVLTEEAT